MMMTEEEKRFDAYRPSASEFRPARPAEPVNLTEGWLGVCGGACSPRAAGSSSPPARQRRRRRAQPLAPAPRVRESGPVRAGPSPSAPPRRWCDAICGAAASDRGARRVCRTGQTNARIQHARVSGQGGALRRCGGVLRFERDEHAGRRLSTLGHLNTRSTWTRLLPSCGAEERNQGGSGQEARLIWPSGSE